MRGLFFSIILISSFSLFSQQEDKRHLNVHFRVNNTFGELTNLVIREIYESGFKDTVFAEKANHSIHIPVNKHVLLSSSAKVMLLKELPLTQMFRMI